MTTTDHVIKQLSIRLIKSEIKARNPKDPKAVEDAIAGRVRIDDVGNVYVVDRDGNRDHAVTFEGFMDQVVKDRPDLWNGSPSHGGKVANPFAPNSWNVTAQMRLFREDHAAATALAAEAGVKL